LADARLTGADKRVLFLWVISGVLGAFFAHRYYFRAFPEASVDFKVSRPTAQQRAKQFVEGLGENIAGYQSAIVFQLDENAKTYLERELGLDRDKLNVNGGAIAIGHPLAATGIRLSVTVSRELRRANLRYGIASACIGGGQGIALLVENPR